MAEIHFFMTVNDTKEFAAFLVDKFQATFTVEDSPTVEHPVYAQLEEVMRAVENTTHDARFFVLSTLWQQHPLVSTEIQTKDGRHYFSINQRYGGPAFDF